MTAQNNIEASPLFFSPQLSEKILKSIVDSFTLRTNNLDLDRISTKRSGLLFVCASITIGPEFSFSPESWKMKGAQLTSLTLGRKQPVYGDTKDWSEIAFFFCPFGFYACIRPPPFFYEERNFCEEEFILVVKFSGAATLLIVPCAMLVLYKVR